MMKRILAALILGGVVGLSPAAAVGAEYTSITLAGGVTVEYAVVLPDGYTEDRDWPALLAFPPAPRMATWSTPA